VDYFYFKGKGQSLALDSIVSTSQTRDRRPYDLGSGSQLA